MWGTDAMTTLRYTGIPSVREMQTCFSSTPWIGHYLLGNYLHIAKHSLGSSGSRHMCSFWLSVF